MRLAGRIGVLVLCGAAAGSIPATGWAASGSGLFWPYTTRSFPYGLRPEAVAIADVNGDGRNDVLLTTTGDVNHSLRVYLQAPTGELATNAIIHSAIENPYSLDVGDLDGDGRTDVVVGSSPYPNPYNGGRPRLVIYRQDASGTLQSVKAYINVNARRVAVGDLNADGRLDVVGFDPSFGAVDTFLQNADGSWAPPVTYGGLLMGSPPRQVEVADVNGDGRQDIVIPGLYSNFEDHLGVLAQQADGTFGAALYHYLPRSQRTAAVGDANADGRDDVVVAHYGTEAGSYLISVLAQNASGAFDSPYTVPTHRVPDALQLADLNGDGRPDLVAPHGGSVGIYLQQADGGMAAETFDGAIGQSGTDPDALAVGDINSDGQPDIVMADDQTDRLVILRHRLPHELALALAASSDRVSIGTTVQYTSTVSNNGFLPMTGVTVAYTVPEPLSFVSPGSTCAAVGDMVTCTLGTLSPGTQAQVSIVLAVPQRRRAAGTYVVRVEATATEPEPDRANNMATASTDVVVPCPVAIADGGFERFFGYGDSPWMQGTYGYPGPLCGVAYCPSDATARPRTGTGWLWLGGEAYAGPEWVSQPVLLRPGTPALLRFFLWSGEVSGSGTGVLEVLVDGATVFETLEGDARYASGYSEVVVDVSAMSDGRPHELVFGYRPGSPGVTSFSIDDVRIETPRPGRPPGRRDSCR